MITYAINCYLKVNYRRFVNKDMLLISFIAGQDDCHKNLDEEM